MGRVWGFSASIRLGGAGPIWAGVRLYTLYGVCPGTDASIKSTYGLPRSVFTVLGRHKLASVLQVAS